MALTTLATFVVITHAFPVRADETGVMARACVEAGGSIGPCLGEETNFWENRAAIAIAGLEAMFAMEGANLGGLDPSTFS